MKNFIIKIIKYYSEEYFKEIELRNKILRYPLGLSFTEDDLKKEINEIHIGAFSGNKLVGCLVLKHIDSEIIQMRQVTVEEKYRSQGIGKGLVLFSEKYSKEKRYKKIILHARDTAINFYEKLSYKKVGSEFIEVKIPHWEMVKIL